MIEVAAKPDDVIIVGHHQGPDAMDKPLLDAPEHEKAKWWRSKIAKLSRRELAELTGYSESAIADLEAGHNRTSGKAIDANTLRKYRMVCAAAYLGIEFDWTTITLNPQRVKIIVEGEN